MHWEELLAGASSWWEEDEFVISYLNIFPQRPLGANDMPDVIQRFWTTFNWSADPWIRDHRGNMLALSTYTKIKECTLEALQIVRTGPSEFVMLIPQPANQSVPHTDAKLRRWATALLLSSPGLLIGSELNTRPPLVFRHAPPFKSSYHWNLRANGIIDGLETGCAQEYSHSATMLQGQDGLHWFAEGSFPQLDICCPIERQTEINALRKWGLVFEAHPQLHQFPWSVPDVTPNQAVTKAFVAQAFRYCKNKFADSMQKFVAQLEAKAAKDDWKRAAFMQTPRQLWSHANGFSEYQVWTGYRVALGQLNLYHAGRSEDKSCRKILACRGCHETMEHIFWLCPCAVALWTKIVTQWTGERESHQRTQHFLGACARRQVQAVTKHRAGMLKERFQDDVEEAKRVWKRIWHILATICQTKLGNNRNEAVYREATINICGSTQSYWATCICHLRATAKRDYRKVATATQGSMLYACIELLEREPTGVPVFTVPSHRQPPSHLPAITAWLQTYQRSCT